MRKRGNQKMNTSEDRIPFPGQEVKTVTIYIRKNEQDASIQICMPLFENEEEPLSNNT